MRIVTTTQKKNIEKIINKHNEKNETGVMVRRSRRDVLIFNLLAEVRGGGNEKETAPAYLPLKLCRSRAELLVLRRTSSCVIRNEGTSELGLHVQTAILKVYKFSRSRGVPGLE